MVSLSLIPNCVVLKYKTQMMNNKPIQHKLLYPTYITSDPLYCIGLSLILTLSDCTAGHMMVQPNSRWWRIFFLQYFFCLVKYLLLTTVIIPNIKYCTDFCCCSQYLLVDNIKELVDTGRS